MISRLKEETETLLKNYAVTKKEPDSYSHMKYPKIFTLMDFYVDQYEIEGFGHLMIMHTKTKMGMELLTASFMPNTGINLPYLLMDAMTMKNKRCIFVEYYGCGNDDLNDTKLKETYEKYRSLPDYAEKENWYIKERRPYSLIKTGSSEELLSMARDSLSAYLDSVKTAHVSEGYKEKLEAFRNRMITEGNPSSKTLKMLLKEEGAVNFFKDVIMPL